MSVGRNQASVFFPWERRGGVRSVLGRARSRQALVAIGGVTIFVLLHRLERNASEVRATRNRITMTTNAVAAWRADHDRKCPPSLADLVNAGYLTELPRDAWGRPLRVTCPGRRPSRDFEVSSDGPDGRPGGLDRVE
ncbi:MAG TPA: type II secretion system protein GspG [Polyangiaceae bacterium]|nr:type II secretion system protein GspG [Polyangiaceae bacterium]